MRTYTSPWPGDRTYTPPRCR